MGDTGQYGGRDQIKKEAILKFKIASFFIQIVFKVIVEQLFFLFVS